MTSIHFGNYIIQNKKDTVVENNDKMTIDFCGLNKVIINNYQVEETPLSILKLLREISSRIHQTHDDDNMAKIKHFQNNLISELGQTPYWELKEYLSAEFKEFIIHFPQYSLYHLINLIQKIKKLSNISYNQTATEQLKKDNRELVEEIKKLKNQLSNISYNQTATEQLKKDNRELLEELQNLNILKKDNRELEEELKKIKELNSYNQKAKEKFQQELKELNSYNQKIKEPLQQDNKELKRENKDLKKEIEDFLEIIKGLQTNLEVQTQKSRAGEEAFIGLSITHKKIKGLYNNLLILNSNLVTKTQSTDFLIEKILKMNNDNQYEELITIIEIAKFVWCSNIGKHSKGECEDRTDFVKKLYLSCCKKDKKERTIKVSNIIASQNFWRKIEEKYKINNDMYNYAWLFMKECNDEEVLRKNLPQFLYDIQQMIYLKN